MSEDLKYLNISLSVGKVLELAEQAKLVISEGKKVVSVAAFKIDQVDNGPSYKSEGVVVWENVKKATVASTVENI